MTQNTEETKALSTEEKALWLANKLMAVVEHNKDTALNADGTPISKMQQIKDRAARMRLVNAIHEIFEPIMKSLDAEYDSLRKKIIPELMQEEDVRSIVIDGIGRVQLAADCYASIPADQQEAAFIFLRSNNYGSLIKETVHSGTLKSWAKEGMEQGRVLPEGVFKIEPYTRASIVKVKAPAAKK